MQWENHWLRHIRLGETVLTVKDEYWKDGRERRYVLFLYNDYDYFETVVEDGFLKEKTSLSQMALLTVIRCQAKIRCR